MHLNLRPTLPRDLLAMRPTKDAPSSAEALPVQRVAERPSDRRRDDAQPRRQKPDRRQPDRPTADGPLSRAFVSLAATLAVLDLAAAPPPEEAAKEETRDAASFDLLLSNAAG